MDISVLFWMNKIGCVNSFLLLEDKTVDNSLNRLFYYPRTFETKLSYFCEGIKDRLSRIDSVLEYRLKKIRASLKVLVWKRENWQRLKQSKCHMETSPKNAIIAFIHTLIKIDKMFLSHTISSMTALVVKQDNRGKWDELIM